MSYRTKVSNRASESFFRRTAQNVKAMNIYTKIMRGGTRL